MNQVKELFLLDELAMIMLFVLAVVGATVGFFASRYLAGDAKYKNFFIVLPLLLGSIFVMVTANHLGLLLTTWGLSSWLLLMLMVHKADWRAAYQSGILAGKNFSAGFCMLAAAFLLLYAGAGTAVISEIVQCNYQPIILVPALLLLVLASASQSAIWPFHRWLLSSLNSPTPVSAMMHAGLVNGGGFLLARFAPLYLNCSWLLNVLFIIGLFTALLGTQWKLMQSDVKRMLACSTMAQMGFMFVQCGLGLVSACVAHLCWHGFFKAYLFLAAGSAVTEKKIDLAYPESWQVFALACLCGASGSTVFAFITHKNMLALEPNCVLICLALIAGIQFALPLLQDLQKNPWQKFVAAQLATMAVAGMYGTSVYAIEAVIGQAFVPCALQLHLLHVIGLLVLICAWSSMWLRQIYRDSGPAPAWCLHFYVWMLNASQPDPKTITMHRNHYQYQNKLRGTV